MAHAIHSKENARFDKQQALTDDQCFFRKRCFHVNVLNGGHTFAKLYLVAISGQNQFQFRNHRKQVMKIEESQMRDAENLAFHRALAIGNDGVKTVAEFFYDDSRIHAGRRPDGGHGRSG
jgi:hypothetical protein